MRTLTVCSENRYYKLKKTHWDRSAGPEMLGTESTSTSAKTKAKATPKSKKRQLEADVEDEEATPTAKGKGGAKKLKVDDGDVEEQPKIEPGSEED